MGESPGYINSEIDANERLRRMYFYEAPKAYRRFRLGHAVAASSAVPVLFDPLELPGLYPDRNIRLSDGGVHDNQGVAGLLEQECTVLLVSDASGQMNTQASPGCDRVSVLMRTNSALMERVRWAEYDEVSARRNGGVLAGLMFVHLKKELETQPVNWSGNTDPPEPPDDPTATVVKESEASKTGYGVLKKRQRMLAAIRTDLDAFSEEEAYGLMLSGYRMVGKDFPSCISGFPVSEQNEAWEFRKVAPLLDDPGRQPRVLHVAGCRSGKVWKLLPRLRLGAGLMTLLLAAVLLRLYWLMVAPSAMVAAQNLFMCLGAVAVLLGAVALGGMAMGRVGIRKSFSQFVFGLGLCTVGWLVARLHLWLVRPCYLEYGRIGGPPRRGPTFRLAATVAATILILLAASFLVLRNGTRIAVTWASRAAQYSQTHGDLQRAVDEWSRVLQLSPANALAHRKRAGAYLALQQPAAAREDLDAAIHGGLRPYADRALVRIALGDYQGAVADYQEALRDAPNDAGLWRQLGYARRLAGDLFGSRAAYSQALRLAPDAQAKAEVGWLDTALPTQSEPPPAVTLYIQDASREM
jgi:tetratricopeptide (TPR) repeat protein